MNKFLFFVFIFGIHLHVFANTQGDVNEVLKNKSTQACQEMLPLYLISLEDRYAEKPHLETKKKLISRYDQDEKKQFLYTQVLERDAFIDIIIDTTNQHAQKIMKKHPNEPEKYKFSLAASKVTFPITCYVEMRSLFEEIIAE